MAEPELEPEPAADDAPQPTTAAPKARCWIVHGRHGAIVRAAIELDSIVVGELAKGTETQVLRSVPCK